MKWAVWRYLHDMRLPDLGLSASPRMRSCCIATRLCADGLRPDKALFIKGPPRNGKSTIVKAVHMIIGEGYGAVAHEDLLAAVKCKHDDVKAHIIGKRVVITAETAGDQRLDVKFFKRLTGGDGLNARRL
ncbi:MAG: hypothetical protein L0H31_03140 [Nocardioidaceae bacterium]|nr:hypothetical protein [Nocardioidaceae bacterium]